MIVQRRGCCDRSPFSPQGSSSQAAKALGLLRYHVWRLALIGVFTPRERGKICFCDPLVPTARKRRERGKSFVSFPFCSHFFVSFPFCAHREKEKESQRERVTKRKSHKEKGSQRGRVTKRKGHKEEGSQRGRVTKRKGHKEKGSQRGRVTDIAEGHEVTRPCRGQPFHLFVASVGA